MPPPCAPDATPPVGEGRRAERCRTRRRKRHVVRAEIGAGGVACTNAGVSRVADSRGDHHQPKGGQYVDSGTDTEGDHRLDSHLAANANADADAYVDTSFFVGGLDLHATEAREAEASILVCPRSPSSSYFGNAYVNFHTVQAAETAPDTLNYTCINGRSCRIM